MKIRISLILRVFFLIVAISMVFPRPTHAYIDPGTGSYVFQMLIAGLLGLMVSLKMFWRQISAFLKSLFNSSNGKKSKK